MKLNKLGLPYMGSKRRLSKQIIDEILQANPKAKYFYDLFGGGGAISLEAVQRTQLKEVYYNEFNTSITELMKKLKTDGVTDEFYKWVSRDEFMSSKDNSDWLSGLYLTMWSFGNKQKEYMYGKEREEIKLKLHNSVVNKSQSDLDEINSIYDTDIEFNDNDSIETRRLKLIKIERLEHLERLNIIKEIVKLPLLDNIEISNLSYNEVKIETPIDETIIYLDPPYDNTCEYQKNNFNHRELEDYINNSPYKIYVSSYNFNLPKVASFEHTTSLSSINTNKVQENLYCNQEHKKGIEEW